jgi:hypothetical protein
MVAFSSLTLLPWLTAAPYGLPIGLSGANGLMVGRSTLLKVLTLSLRSFPVYNLSLDAVVTHI